MADAADRSGGGDTLRSALARLADSVLGLLRTRLELAAVEYSEERSRISQQAILLIAGLGCILFALFFAAVLVIAYFWDSNRLVAIGGVIAFFVVIGAALLWRRAEVSANAPLPFSATVAELEKDRAALARTMKLPPS
jgi:uncharacterized membrane protein YqjE